MKKSVQQSCPELRKAHSVTHSSNYSLDKVKSLHERSARAMLHSHEVQEICRCLELDDNQLREVMARMELDFKKGLDPLTAPTASVKMLPTYIRAIAVGEERGEFLALDLGGTNFRVLLITLEGDCRSTMQSKIYRVPDHIQKGTGAALFDHIAACLAKFMDEHKLTGRPKLPLGFTFSFPCQQHGLTSARLSNWTKGFKASGVVGEDVVQLLLEACLRRGDVDIDVMARIPHFGAGISDGLPEKICVNTECGGFGDDGALDPFLIVYDRQLDERSINPGRQRFEKTISGMYMAFVSTGSSRSKRSESKQRKGRLIMCK
ncbi:hypothetical protein niasHS_011371 [Heterodera schachtii]|uniref:Phosphotransferase n=1 Tax=Heterodera schachtii TaxID=97005 RepID=A0ABD2III6_HETSC